MHRKILTRVPAFQFKYKKRKLLRLGYFRNEEDLFDAYCHWMDYYDPIGIVRHPSIYQEYAPEVRNLLKAAKNCSSSEEFSLKIQQCIIHFFNGEYLVKPYFWKNHGYRRMAETGWALWRRYQFDIEMAEKSKTKVAA